MSLIPSGPSVFSSNSLLIWSQPLWFCDGDNGSGRWTATTPFSFNVPRCRQRRHHLEGEGQVITEIYTNKLPGLDGLWGWGEEWSSARCGDGGSYLPGLSSRRPPGEGWGLPGRGEGAVTVSSWRAGTHSNLSHLHSCRGGGCCPQVGGLSWRSPRVACAV